MEHPNVPRERKRNRVNTCKGVSKSVVQNPELSLAKLSKEVEL